ncbi:MAG: hypothetical protein AAF208_10640 [Cyanobacteria bacterium P01_A01_bin.45]
MGSDKQYIFKGKKYSIHVKIGGSGEEGYIFAISLFCALGGKK